MSFPLPRVPTIRLLALGIAASATAMVGLGSAAAHAAPTSTASTPSTTATTATDTSATSTSTTSTSAASTSTSSGVTTAATSGATTGPPVRVAPGPQCPGQSDVLTPVVCIPTGSGEDQPAPIGTNGFLQFAAQVVNNGPAAVPDASVVITLPPGLRLDTDEDESAVIRYEKWWTDDSGDDSTALDCTANSDGSVLTCATGAIAPGANFLVAIDLSAQDNAVAGIDADFTVALESTPVEGVFPTTTVTATVDYVGTAHLQVHLTPTKATVVLGKSLTVTATVHNVGPNPAVEAAGIGFALPDDDGDVYPFVITNSQPFPGGFGPNSPFALQTMAAKTKSTAKTRATAKAKADATTAPAPSPIGFWPIGTIATGATATVTIVVKAVKAGHVELDFDAGSADESCEDGSDPSCENEGSVALTAVAAARTTVATTTAATTAASVSVSTVTVTVTASAGSSTAALANTGFRPAPWVGSGAAAVMLGAGLILAAMPRRRARGCHR